MEKKTVKKEKETVVKEVEKQAQKVVKKAQKQTDEVLKKVVAHQEEIPGGLIDLMSRALARDAKITMDKADDRERIETLIKTKVAASDSHIGTTRDSLSTAFKATR